MNEVDSCSSLFRFALSDLGCLDGRHLLGPTLSRLGFLDGAKVVRRETGDTDVVVTLEDELDVPNVKGRGRAQLGETAGRSNNVVDEIIGHLEDKLVHC